MDQRHESAANPATDRGDNVNPNPGDGASGPGEFAYEGDSQVGDVGGEAAIDIEEKARRMEAGDASADPALAATSGAQVPDADAVVESPEVQSGG